MFFFLTAARKKPSNTKTKQTDERNNTNFDPQQAGGMLQGSKQQAVRTINIKCAQITLDASAELHYEFFGSSWIAEEGEKLR